MKLILTTIHVPTLLENYLLDAKKYDYQNLDVIVIGDKKTPPDTKNFCQKLQAKTHIPISYYDPADQESYLYNYPALAKFIPWNCIQRRNLALLMAYQQNAEVIITIDDDNYIAQEDYFGSHHSVGRTVNIPTKSSATGWFNICQYLKEKHNKKFYARGHSVSARVNDDEQADTVTRSGRVIVNAGFWLGDPDIDALMRIASPVDVTNYTLENNFGLDIGTWAPFNSQNTALHRDCIPAYFLCSGIGRYDDIWASYIVKRIADHLGDYITFGYPLVRQERNPHDLWHDVEQEKFGMQLTDTLCQWLREISLSSQHYLDCTIELITALKAKTLQSSINAEHREFLNHFITGYEIWTQTIKKIDTYSNPQHAYLGVG